MKSFGITDPGKVRTENQDSYVIENCDRRKSVVAVICDGMGGAKAGDLASQLSSKAFVSKVFETILSSRMRLPGYEVLLRESCDAANGVVYEYSRFDANYNGMGTTLVGGVITRHKAHIVNVGDSRAYHINRRGIKQITRDHSYVQELVDSGAISEVEAKIHPKRNIITRALGVDKRIQSDYFDVNLRNGDAILLCSDGLSNTITDAEMLSAYKSDRTPEKVCRTLIDLALERGARDNVSVVLVTI